MGLNLLLLCILFLFKSPKPCSLKNLPLLFCSSSNLSINWFKDKSLWCLGFIFLCWTIHFFGFLFITSFKLLPKILSFNLKLKKWASSIKAVVINLSISFLSVNLAKYASSNIISSFDKSSKVNFDIFLVK